MAAEAHARVCVTCDELLRRALVLSGVAQSFTTPALGQVPRALGRGLTVGTSIGRYTVLGLVGGGGMGEVYAAYDPDLDRRVALKLMRAERGQQDDGGQERLRREAQAIAKLSHRNVVVVHDVGTFSGRVFVAMEFVDGGTLREWLAGGSRSRGEILEAFANAAHGLGASHAAGMVHRDFKPQNVMLRTDGSVVVTDFGLVRQLGDDVAAAVEAPDQPVGSSSRFEAPLGLTRTGDVVGTPAYMAPEQFRAAPTDARTDQFSFCVALYEALYGGRPFEGATFAELRTSVLGGRVRPASDKTGIPSWMRRALLRGLAVDPEERFPSMAALLDALQDDPARRRRKWMAGVGVVGAMAMLAITANRFGSRDRTLCNGGGRLIGIWEPVGVSSERKAKISAAFNRTGKSYAASTFKAAAHLLDDYVARWVGMYRDSCEATHVRGEQSAEILELRSSCLEDRLGNIRALTDVLAQADEHVVLNAVSAAGALPALEPCADLASLRNAPVVDPVTRSNATRLRYELAQVTALRDSGQCARAEQKGVRLIGELEVAKLRPLLAEALFVVGSLGDVCSDPRAAIDRLKEAYAVAISSHADHVAAQAAAGIPLLASSRLGQDDMAKDWLKIGRAALARFGKDDQLEVYLLSAEAFINGVDRNVDRQLSLGRDAYAVAQRAFGADHPLTINALNNLGNGLAAAGRYDEALAADLSAIRAVDRLAGPEQPQFANTSSNACEVLNRMGRHAEAHAFCRRALDIWSAVGTDAAIVSFGRTGLGVALLGEDKPAEAIEPLETAVAERVERHLAPDLLGESRFALARALWSRPKDRPRAISLARQARVDSAADAKAVAAIDAWLARPVAR